jgi:2-polyprenyl-3-methyl-5-hydroxy-6-metoxy-1,4-benzoquinol methylase
MPALTLQEQFGQIDIYLFDQLLKGRIVPGMRILDAGCGHGRNLVYFLREGYEVYGADADPRAIDHIPDGAERYLVDATLLEELTERLGSQLADPLKTTVVQNQRAMTTWVVRRRSQ